MIRIEVSTFAGQPTARPIAADFDELGGSIGRAEGNTLVLPDEKRYISRTQASITFRAGTYYLQDHGSATPTFVNGSAVGNGNEVGLRGNEEIRVGDYVLTVSTAATQSPAAEHADPFADLLAPGRPSQSAAPHPPAASNHQLGPFDDPFAAPAPQANARSDASGVIPQDFDPFADLLPSSSSRASSQPMRDLGLPAASTDSVDDLFDLKAGGNSWDPLAPRDSLPGAHGAVPGALSNDPLAVFGPQSSRPQQHGPVQRDDAPMLSGVFRTPQPRQDQSSAAPAPPQQNGSPPSGRSDDIVVSWDSPASTAPAGEIKTVIVSPPRKGDVASRPERAPEQALPDETAAPGVVLDVVAADSVSAGSAQEQRDLLLRAFLGGAGVTDLKLPDGLTPERMKLLGELLRETINGTLELLVARALTKREVRAQATVIVARENNPLKFSPTVEAALANLLAPQGHHGFMTPVDAVRDAYSDLRSHQFGFMAGMRAALEGILARFDPAQLEQRLTQKSVRGSLLASNRRAKLWELYEQLYRDISKEAEDDFQTLFGREFLRAYEAQIEKLEQDDAANKR